MKHLYEVMTRIHPVVLELGFEKQSLMITRGAKGFCSYNEMCNLTDSLMKLSIDEMMKNGFTKRQICLSILTMCAWVTTGQIDYSYFIDEVTSKERSLRGVL